MFFFVFFGRENLQCSFHHVQKLRVAVESTGKLVNAVQDHLLCYISEDWKDANRSDLGIRIISAISVGVKESDPGRGKSSVRKERDWVCGFLCRKQPG